jgi:hypothetical protein
MDGPCATGGGNAAGGGGVTGGEGGAGAAASAGASTTVVRPGARGPFPKRRRATDGPPAYRVAALEPPITRGPFLGAP